MITRKTDASARDNLYRLLETYCRSIYRRSISYTIEAYSAYYASIVLQIVGKRATGQKKVVIVYDKEYKSWTAISDATEYHLTSLSEITSVLKMKVSKLITVVNKF